jgi:hypothetical protein
MYSDYFLLVILCKILLNKPLINIAEINTDFQIYKVRKHDFLYDSILQLTGLERKVEKLSNTVFVCWKSSLGPISKKTTQEFLK